MSVEFDDLCNKCKESIRSSIDFEMKKQAYVDAREEQKRIIIDALLGKDEEGNLIFACKLVTPEGLCSDYKHRLPMCRKYPQKRILYNAKLHDGCGYKVNVKTFKDYLDKKSK